MTLAVAALSVFATVSCSGRAGTASGARGSASPSGASIAADNDRFPHGLHTGDDPRISGYKGRGLGCGDCHPAEAVIAGESPRPGANGHSPCDDCHRDEFYKPPGKFCRNCHTDIDPKVQGATKMQPYPERGFVQVLAPAFSHRQHLDKAGLDQQLGFHVGCADCHARDDKSRDPMQPGHAECARCHEKEASVKKALPMQNCRGCHPKRDVELVRGRRFITGDLVFAHSTHEKNADGSAIGCDSCHAEVRDSTSSDQVVVPAMVACAECHEDASKTPDRVRIAKCDVCHQSMGPDAISNAPANHMIGSGELPEDHTIEFRQNHGEQAANPNNRCSFCHDTITGSARDNCFACHQVMRPRSHTISWREDSHGREAVSDRDACATCHDAEYCTACHSIPPRSHQPFAEFRAAGHAQEARFDLRSCFACHTFEDSCSDCHRRLR